MFSNVNIREAIELGQVKVENLNDKAIQPASIDLRISSNVYYVADSRVMYALDPFSKESMEKHFRRAYYEAGEWLIRPQQFMLVATERVTLNREVAGQVAGKSSVARFGLIVESAGFIDPGFDGPITLEVYNQMPFPIILTVGMPICQLKVFRLDTPSSKPYSGKYVGSDGPVPSRYYQNERPKND